MHIKDNKSEELALMVKWAAAIIILTGIMLGILMFVQRNSEFPDSAVIIEDSASPETVVANRSMIVVKTESKNFAPSTAGELYMEITEFTVPEQIFAGERISVRATIHNRSIQYVENCRLIWHPADEQQFWPHGPDGLFGVAPNHTAMASAWMIFPEPGDYFTKYGLVDCTGGIPEDDRSWFYELAVRVLPQPTYLTD
jgi:hypothetical protein